MPAPKNPNVERVANVPFDKDAVSPVPQYAPRRRAAGVADVAVTAPLPDAGGAPPHGQEEYPGPQTASSGERVAPGRAPNDREKGA
jgi:hypothetical protein